MTRGESLKRLRGSIIKGVCYLDLVLVVSCQLLVAIAILNHL